MFRNILIPTDGSPLATIAVNAGIVFAKESGARVTILAVTEPFHLFSVEPEQLSGTREEYEALARKHATEMLTALAHKAEAAGVACQTAQVSSNEVYRAIIDQAKLKDADLIIMASHGRSGVGSLMLGSVAAKVLAHSTIPVLIYRAKK
ncbi:universal stress protein [Ensifer adhaerens]|uniref:universal stress protein n=1 Tax=Ensifer adhaerens TaxID=106592 RepID=UPI001CBADF3C|nr:universal stress protein [Ensifer adhaerens]MBZ7925753.1 universal stress protein [Ensifer adhaerens]UAX95071.1 universal stress protein [Ensifer adhaerens]UAY03037.1 universal stress protein [Ensifer adhaerens]UAY11022.1 universal stress protein [Ensifer adhaerens]